MDKDKYYENALENRVLELEKENDILKKEVNYYIHLIEKYDKDLYKYEQEKIEKTNETN